MNRIRSIFIATIFWTIFISNAHAGTVYTPRIGLSSPTVGGFDYPQVLAADGLIIDSSCAVQGLYNNFIASNTFSSTTVMQSSVTLGQGLIFPDATYLRSTTTLLGGSIGSNTQVLYNNSGSVAGTSNLKIFASSATAPGAGGFGVPFNMSAGSATIKNLSTNLFVKTDSSSNLVSGAITSSDIPADVMYKDIYQIVTSSINFSTYVTVGYLSISQCVQTDGSGRLSSSGGACGGGGGGSSALQVTSSGVQITSPTPSMNFNSNDFSLAAVGSTSTIALNPSTTDYIHNGSSHQVATLNIDSGTLTYVKGSTMTYSSATISAQLTVGTLQGGSLATCGDSTHGLGWSAGSFSCQNITGSGGGGIVSPGTYTWVNTFGINVSTMTASTITIPSGNNIIPIYRGATRLVTFGASGSTYFGAGAGSQTSSGEGTAFGFNALQNLTSGQDPVAFGAQALSSLTTGVDDTGIGFGAGQLATIATAMTAVGYGALSANTSDYNTGIGMNAGAGVTTGNFDTLVGAVSGLQLGGGTGGNNNTVVGSYSLYSNLNGNDNVAVGANVATYAPNLNYNTLLGRAVDSEGDYNTFVGWGVYGFSINGSTPTQSTAIGANSYGGTNAVAVGYNSHASTTSSISIGYNAIASSQNAIAIGNGAIAYSSNTAVLGGVTSFVIQGSTPTMGTCGTSPSIAGTNTSGTVVVGAGIVTSCSVIFSPPGFINKPACTFSDNNVAINIGYSSITTAGFTTSFSASIGSGEFTYNCIGRQ